MELDWFLDAADGFAEHPDRAAAAIDEVGKFGPAGAAEVPASAFITRAGGAVWERDPGRFRLDRLRAEREAYARAATQA